MNGTWSISSNDGWNRATIAVSTFVVSSDGRQQLPSSLLIRHLFWDRSDVARSGSFDAPAVEDLHTRVPQVLLGLAQMERLASLMQQWLRDYSEFRVDLAIEANQQLVVAVGEREELICKPESPALTVRYQAERVGALEVYFPVDQSCISAALEELNEVLSDQGRS